MSHEAPGFDQDPELEREMREHNVFSGDLHERLGVSGDADGEEIWQAYKELAPLHHPYGNGTNEEFDKLFEAYETLAANARERERRNIVDSDPQVERLLSKYRPESTDKDRGGKLDIET